MEYLIYKVGPGWYNFEALPQGYIRIYNVFSRSDAQAIRQGERIAGKNNTYKIIEKGGKE